MENLKVNKGMGRVSEILNLPSTVSQIDKCPSTVFVYSNRIS
ncbi:hypothetical protein AVDCRST_MAG92-4624 [uncultured Coleofasciculus sp.]|uniref:Uncharacterized protein n=1 Tax=uncultured Coleofasciculus sp. TaxID=1267456 RepID=A0A6J4K3H4_9CYAN|nr:hypothetical protein AVDCRST_MAG92-4624 [uncultured Coleofasciculus sp.]